MICRICGGENSIRLGSVEYYTGYLWDIYECTECGSRFSQHDKGIYEWMHKQSGSIYGIYREQAAKCKKLFDNQDLQRLKDLLCMTGKYKFIIESIISDDKDIKILEIGCSRGHLTSYFILSGYDILGVDISKEAVDGAIAVFGDHFMLFEPKSVSENGPYDVIYHVGTIGCVDDPLGFTRELLKLLKPGGKLLFNAPNVASCWQKDQLWVDEAPPPDLVILFKPGFWKQQFNHLREVEEMIETYSPEQSAVINFKKLLRKKWQAPIPVALEDSINNYKSATHSGQSGLSCICWRLIERIIVYLTRLSGLPILSKPQPYPFGIYVRMTK